MKKICVTLILCGICSQSGAMTKSNGLYISYSSTLGKTVKKELADIKKEDFQEMPADLLEVISSFVDCYREYISCQKNQSPEDILLPSISSNEQKFLSKIEKKRDFLEKGYSKLNCNLDEKVLKKIDANLCAMLAKAKTASTCRQLAEEYKQLANSTKKSQYFSRAAFWFRMLYAYGEHSSYLDEYNNMISRAAQKGE